MLTVSTQSAHRVIHRPDCVNSRRRRAPAAQLVCRSVYQHVEVWRVFGCAVLLHVRLCLFWTSVSDLVSGVWYAVHDAVLTAHFFFSAGLSGVEMAESGTEGELPQRRLGVKEQQNGELTGKNKSHLIFLMYTKYKSNMQQSRGLSSSVAKKSSPNCFISFDLILLHRSHMV